MPKQYHVTDTFELDGVTHERGADVELELSEEQEKELTDNGKIAAPEASTGDGEGDQADAGEADGTAQADTAGEGQA